MKKPWETDICSRFAGKDSERVGQNKQSDVVNRVRAAAILASMDSSISPPSPAGEIDAAASLDGSGAIGFASIIASAVPFNFEGMDAGPRICSMGLLACLISASLCFLEARCVR